MKLKAAVFRMSVVGFLSSSCGGEREHAAAGEWAGSVDVTNGVSVVRNPAQPLRGQLTLELEEDLVVGDTLHEESFFFNRIHAGVDGNGTLFIWDPNSFRIQVFDSEGRFVRTTGRQGEGPGEFSDAFGLEFRVGALGELAVLDGGRLQFFDSSGAYRRRVLVPTMTSRFTVLGGGRMLWDQVGSDAAGPTEEVMVMDASGDLVQRLASYPSERWRGAFIDRLRFTHLAPELVLAPWGDHGGAFGFPLAYRVTLVGADGQIARVIEVDEAPREVDADLESALIEDMSSDAPGRTPRDLDGEVYIPETWPFFDALFSDEHGNVLVQRSEPLPVPDADTRLDLFTADGVYLYDLRVPVVDIQSVRNGFLYVRRFDRDMNVGQLVRYRILNWDVVMETR